MQRKQPKVVRQPQITTKQAVLLIVPLVGAAVLFVFIGQNDVSTALTYIGRLAGVLVLCAALITLIAAAAAGYCRWGPRQLQHSWLAVVVGVVVVSASFLVLLIVHINGHDYSQLTLLIWIGFIFWSFWAFWQLIFRQNVLQGTTYPTALRIGVAITGLVALGNFMYSRVYEPSVSPINLSITTRFGTPRPNLDGRSIYLPLTIRLKNKSKIGLYLLGNVLYVYNLRGKYEATPKTDEELVDESVAGYPLDRFRRPGEFEVIRGGGFLLAARERVDQLSPGEEREYEQVIVVPKGPEYDVIRTWAQVTVLRVDAAKLSHQCFATVTEARRGCGYPLPGWVKNRSATEYLLHYVELEPGNQILKWTRKHRKVFVYLPIATRQTAAGMSLPRLKFVIAVVKHGRPPKEPGESDKVEFLMRYGLTNVTSGITAISVSASLPAR